MSISLENLNKMQKEAVTTINGPLLVLAGAGSGKTKALTSRIAFMIKEKGIHPDNILAVTFTNKAAGEMRDRVVSMLNNEHEKFSVPLVSTFHSLCVRILRKNIDRLLYDNSFVIYDTADQQLLMKKVLENMALDTKKFNPKSVLNRISGAKNQLISAEKFHSYCNGFFDDTIEKAYRNYQSALKKNNALDFDDIIMLTVQLFEENEEILNYYQDKYLYISIDEYQDTNHAQYVLTNQLAKKYRNLCVIGDSDQSIYSFRGANIKNILDFEKDYPDAKTVFLEQNYRSTQIILDAAHAIIEKNTNRKDKKLWTSNKSGEQIILRELRNERAEGEFIAQEINSLINSGKSAEYKDFVVLYRTNAQSRAIEESMLRFGIPYKIIGGIKFYERKEIKDLIAYLRVIHNFSDTVSLLRIINVPSRKIGEKTIESIQRVAHLHDIGFWKVISDLDSFESLRSIKNQTIKKFVDLMNEMRSVATKFTVSGLIKHILDFTGYRAMLEDGTLDGESRLQNAKELISVASKYDNLQPLESLGIFLEEIALIGDMDKYDESEDAVTLMTVHSAKGLEFKTVFLAGLEDGIFPHSRSILEREELEEERRLMYVAITRAKERLYLLHAGSRMLYGDSKSNPLSQFIMDIPPSVLKNDFVERISGNGSRKFFSSQQYTDSDGFPITPVFEHDNESKERDYSAGDLVHHKVFGAGTVISLQGGVITVCFKSKKHGIKKLALSVAPLTKLQNLEQ